MASVVIDSGDEFLKATWFNQSWVLGKVRHGDAVLFSGKPKRRAGRWEMTHPRIQVIDADDLEAHGGLLPKYPLTDGVTMEVMRRVTRDAADRFVEHVEDPIPEAWWDGLVSSVSMRRWPECIVPNRSTITSRRVGG
ncbi:MAG: hypothetical protein Ct9H300mP1_33350 [Planctomycetaceae bacterium]|nr:MAG: hypothetical protein Ct9H300mP1_33350 [Planctomycetaceae bacterium]